MIEWLRIVLIVLLAWRVLVIFYRPSYLRDSNSNDKYFKFNLGGKNSVSISITFFWQISAILGAIGIVVVSYILIQEYRYDKKYLVSTESSETGDSVWITEKSGYILRKYPQKTLLRSNRVIDGRLPAGTKLEVLDFDSKEWFRVSYSEDSENVVGYVNKKSALSENEVKIFVREFIYNISTDSFAGKRMACEQLIRWEGRCDEPFFYEAPEYEGINELKYVSDPKVDTVENGKLVVTAKYMMTYNQDAYLALQGRGVSECLYKDIINSGMGYKFGLANLKQLANMDKMKQNLSQFYDEYGFIYNEYFYIFRLNDGRLKIWSSVIKDKQCYLSKIYENWYNVDSFSF